MTWAWLASRSPDGETRQQRVVFFLLFGRRIDGRIDVHAPASVGVVFSVVAATSVVVVVAELRYALGGANAHESIPHTKRLFYPPRISKASSVAAQTQRTRRL